MVGIKMAKIEEKPVTLRTAIAKCEVWLSSETLEQVLNQTLTKGDVITTAQVAGIMAAKRTPEWIPLCHPLNLTHAEVNIEPMQHLDKPIGLEITATIRLEGKTGVEMEALTACAAAALTIYDMCKPLQKDIQITHLRLVSKTGGKSGDYEEIRAGKED